MAGNCLSVSLYSWEQTGSGGQHEDCGSHAPLGKDNTRSDSESARRMHLPANIPYQHMPTHEAKHDTTIPVMSASASPTVKR